ncbi:MAG: radical SAM protein, partial [bacterium]|nr:radical SAM protein [bacterium]
MLLKTPLEVYWILTDRCNLKCNFCLSESDSAPRAQELAAEQREKVLQDLIQSKVLKVYLTGGEPLLIPETVDYVRRLRAHNVFTVLTTNGVLLDRRLIGHLEHCGLNRIQVSIHGSTPEMNDGIMGGPAFDAIMKNLDAISRSGLDLHLKITATRENIHDLPRLVEQLGAFGASLINIWEITPMGRGFYNRDALQPPIGALEEARARVADFNGRGMRVSFMSQTLQAAEFGRPSSCNVGNRTAATFLIMADGNMTPCTPAHIW